MKQNFNDKFMIGTDHILRKLDNEALKTISSFHLLDIMNQFETYDKEDLMEKLMIA